MALTREQALKIVNDERDYQDTTFDPNKVTSSGLTRAERDKECAVGIMMLSTYVRKAEDAWTNDRKADSLPALQQVAKIAAIAVRILERAGESGRLLTEGLR